MRPSDPAYWMLDNVPRTPVEAYRDYCYICTDDEFARMGLPLCNFCPTCKTGHVPADDVICDDCDADIQRWYHRREMRVSCRADVLRYMLLTSR